MGHSFNQSDIKGSLLIASGEKKSFLIKREISLRRLPLFLLWVRLYEEVMFGSVVAILFVSKIVSQENIAKLSQSTDSSKAARGSQSWTSIL